MIKVEIESVFLRSLVIDFLVPNILERIFKGDIFSSIKFLREKSTKDDVLVLTLRTSGTLRVNP